MLADLWDERSIIRTTWPNIREENKGSRTSLFLTLSGSIKLATIPYERPRQG